jgi:nitrogen-specific signal transduction histidine kinase
MAPELKFDGTFDYVICFSRDITKEREAERKEIDSEKAEAANRLHQQIANEINNPLQALRNTIYLMKRDSDDELPSHVERADELLGRVETLLKRMLVDSDSGSSDGAGRSLASDPERK